MGDCYDECWCVIAYLAKRMCGTVSAGVCQFNVCTPCRLPRRAADV